MQCIKERGIDSDHCFPTAKSRLWKSLPEMLRQPDITFGQFKRSLKMSTEFTEAVNATTLTA